MNEATFKTPCLFYLYDPLEKKTIGTENRSMVAMVGVEKVIIEGHEGFCVCVCEWE